MSGQVFSFYGVSTGGSSIMRLFPLWAEELGLGDVRIEGTDLQIHAPADVYRARVQRLKADRDELGALVTTHKIDLFEACRDLFDEIDPLAELCGETSCLSKREGRLRAHAKDPISAGRTLDAMLPAGYWSDGGELLCLGAGGSAIAIAVHLLSARPAGDRPRRLVAADLDPVRLDALRAIVEQLDHDVAVEYALADRPETCDALLAGLPERSVVVNATGRGKDTPGSPVTDAAVFPRHGVAWELNYRGELDFLQQARAQEAERDLAVHDGWPYFIHGWASVIEEVFAVPLGPERIDALTRIADDVRSAGARA